MTKNILHISTYDSGGAGLAALRLHKSLLKVGVRSNMLVAHKSSNLSSVHLAQESNLNRFIPPKNIFLRYAKILQRKMGCGIPQLEKYTQEISYLKQKYPTSFSFPISTFDLSNNSLVKEADIIHLHWIGNFVDFKTFFPNITKPILWTFHDMNPLFGGFHHIRLKEKYYDQYKEIEDACYNLKKNVLKPKENLSIVAVSSQMKNLILENEIYKSKPIYTIYNSVDESLFKHYDKKSIREILNINPEKIVFLFANKDINDSEKGLKELLIALDSLKIPNSELICIGDGVIPINTTYPIQRFASVNDSIWLSMLYSAADFLVFPSFQESFGQTAIEAMCCGTPVIMTPVGIAPELINETNGECCTGFSIEAISNGIKKALSRKYDSQTIREQIVQNLNSNKIANQYINLYNTI